MEIYDITMTSQKTFYYAFSSYVRGNSSREHPLPAFENTVQMPSPAGNFCWQINCSLFLLWWSNAWPPSLSNQYTKLLVAIFNKHNSFSSIELHKTGHEMNHCDCVCEVGTVGKISDCQPWGPGFNPRPGRGLNFGQPSFATPSMDRDVKLLV